MKLGAPAAALVVLMGCIAACSSGSGAQAARSTTTRGGGSRERLYRVSGPSAGCGAGHRAAPGTTDDTITSGGRQRHYELIVPADYDGTTALPLIFTLHSLTIDYHVVPPMAGLPDEAKHRDFIAVSPSGLLGKGNKPYWNAAPVKHNDDVEFIADLLDHLEATLCIDTAKVFSLGMSNGAQMSSLLACRLGGRIAGIGAISGVEYNRPCDTPPTAIVAFGGTKDPFVPFAGGGLNSVTIAKRNYYHGKVPAGTPTPPGVETSMKRWAEHNHCAPKPVTTRLSSDVTERRWEHCEATTKLYIIEGGGHTWPGKCIPGMEKSFGKCAADLDATEIMFRMMLGKPER